VKRISWDDKRFTLGDNCQGMSGKSTRILDDVKTYYEGKLAAHSATPRGVDWNSEDSQRLRFRQLLEVSRDHSEFSILDYGCGYGALLEELRARKVSYTYTGFDVSDKMVKEAEKLHASDRACRFTSKADTLIPCDFVVASGLFNVKQSTPLDEWEAYVIATLDRLHALSRKGFAFNMLTSYSDPERIKPELLYYANPGFFFDVCKQRYSKWVALLHDYGLWEFTIRVSKP
jgi:SAM-dependent methyltransferase